MPRFHFKIRPRLGPFYLVITEKGIRSWGVKIGRYTRNMTRKTNSFDTPGPGSVKW